MIVMKGNRFYINPFLLHFRWQESKKHRFVSGDVCFIVLLMMMMYLSTWMMMIMFVLELKNDSPDDCLLT